jgi:hypothetical protein
MKLTEGANEGWDGYRQVAALRELLAEIAGKGAPDEVSTAAKAFDAKLATAAGTPGGGRRGGGGGPGVGGPPPVPNFAGVNAALLRQLGTLDFGDMAPNEPMLRAWRSGCGDLKTAVANWNALRTKGLATFNAVLAKNGLKPAVANAPMLAEPACSAPAMTRVSGRRGR